jgi:hypothetical protein
MNKAITMNKEISVRETAGIDRAEEYLRVAVPFARGEILPERRLTLIEPDGTFHPVQTQVLKQWPDKSVKWLLADFAASVPADSTTLWRLVGDPKAFPLPDPIKVVERADLWQVDTGKGVFHLDARIFRPFVKVLGPDGDVLAPGGSCCLFSLNGLDYLRPEIEEIVLEDSGPLHVVIRMSGVFSPPTRQGLRFSSRLHFYSGSMAVKVEVTLHNPQAARHPKGLWDLGDEGSVFFKELAFAFPLKSGPDKDVFCISEPGEQPITLSGNQALSIYQESSGGENWQSPNHRNHQGRVPMPRRGYVVEEDGREHAAGLRATPLVWCGTPAGRGVAAAIPGFWQEFPKQIEATNDQLKIALFPGRFPDLHELQGGEQKTHAFQVDFFALPDSLNGALTPLQGMAAPSVYQASGIFADLPAEDDLVDHFTSAEKILAKREVVDEYGWRHFGEIHADHEAVNHQGAESFVSHYNNQYDFVGGAYRKAFATGNARWLEIAADLARHVRDIDLYHTDEDREEYNRGLFWHTDHYAAAGLSSHRSYSREQKGAYELHSGGGGPGAEHCYTTGLVLYYFQTGNPDYKQAVIDLAEWALLALTGPQTVLAALKRGVGYLQLWRSTGGKQRLFPRHPLTRGTGNAIVACLDAFEVGGDHRFLDRADELIRHTLHPKDDLSGRDLLNAEIAWSYTVLLSAVAKFLDKKAELVEFDGSFAHARASLVAYAGWMVEHEYPYLEKPGILEYPNETWAAQDLRKSVVFYQAARYADSLEQQETFIERARFFFSYAREELPKHPSSFFTRPVVLMLQNGWVGDRLSSDFVSGDISPLPAPVGRPTPSLSLGQVLGRIGSELIRTLPQTSLKRELAWLRARVNHG